VRYNNKKLRPGDQDRFNWLFDLTPVATYLSSKPRIAECQSKKFDSLLHHWCLSGRLKASAAKRASNAARVRLGITSELDWEQRDAWSILRNQVAVFPIDESKSTVEMLHSIDSGDAELKAIVP